MRLCANFHCCCASRNDPAVGMQNLTQLPAPALCICAGNMMLFNSDGLIQKYACPEDILRDFYDLRLRYYAKRRSALLRVRSCAGPGGPDLMRAPQSRACK